MWKVSLIVLLGLIAANTYGLVISVPGFVTETYAQYSPPGSSGAGYAEFDSAGNLYLTHGDGSLVKIDTNGQSSVVGSFLNLQGICYAGGTIYGDVLYFNDAYGHETLARQADGTTSTFAATGGTPIGITIDRNGIFGGSMFVSRRYGYGDIYRINEAGEHELFTQIGSGMSGHDIESDPTGNYGGLLYICASDETTDVFTAWSVQPDGTVSQFSEMTKIKDLEFDTTQTSAFGGLLYAKRSSWAIGTFSPDGQWSLFATSGDSVIRSMTFGPDNSMYVVEEIAGEDVVTITKVSVPEPSSILLLIFSGFLIRKR